MAQKGETQKISKKKQRIKKYKITTNQELPTGKRILQNENSSKSSKSRENMCKTSKQVSQNQIFPNNRNKFFRNLGKEHISVEKPPKKEPTETFWHSLLENIMESTTIQQGG